MKFSYTLHLLVLINLSLKTSSGHYSNESTAADDTFGINQNNQQMLYPVQNARRLQQKWIQVGGDILGEAEGDDFGRESIAMSSDGNRIAVGAIGDGNFSGHVRVYDYDDLVSGGRWIQVGSDIDGDAAEDTAGRSIALSSDGNRIAIGAPSFAIGYVRVHDLVSGEWVQVGSDIDGEARGDDSGGAVAMSSDGNRVVIGAYRNDGNAFCAGHVRVYSLVSGEWIQVGSDIDGEAEGDRFGTSVAMSSDGNRIVIGATLNDGNGDNSGHVRVFGLTSGAWSRVGSDIEGEAERVRSGRSVAMSSDGNRIAIGTPDIDLVRVYDLVSGEWIQVGNDIDGESKGDASGSSITMSSDGNRIAIGAPDNDANGHVRVYEWESGMWIQVGRDIDGESGDAPFIGTSLAMSSDGSRFAVGSGDEYFEGGELPRGLVRVFMAPTSIPPASPTGDAYSAPAWYTQLADNFVGTNLQRCRKRKGVPPSESKSCQRTAKTCFFGEQQCPNGVGPHPVTRCFCDGVGGEQVWTCAEVECPSSSTEPIM